MTYCTPRAVQEQILKRKLAASGCAVSWNTDRPEAATRRPTLPDDLQLHLLGYVRDASTVLALEIASKAVLSLRRSSSRHKEHEQMWVGFLRARFPREAPALLSLGDNERRLGFPPRANARGLYKAFCQKKCAVTNIDTVDLEVDDDASEELAFIARVGRFAGLVSWTEIEYHGRERPLLRWQPKSSEAPIGVLELDDVAEDATIEEVTGDRLRQELHVIDLRTMNCATLFSRIPTSIGLLGTYRRAICETHAAGFFMHDERVGFGQHLTTRLQHALDDGTCVCCLIEPILLLREVMPDCSSYNLALADFILNPFDWPVSTIVQSPEDVCGFMAEVIRQTHSLGVCVSKLL